MRTALIKESKVAVAPIVTKHTFLTGGADARGDIGHAGRSEVGNRLSRWVFCMASFELHIALQYAMDGREAET